MDKLTIAEGEQEQASDESRVYSVNVSKWTTGPSSAQVNAYDITNASLDVTGTILSGTPSVSGAVITWPLLQSLSVNHAYDIKITFAHGSNTSAVRARFSCPW